ncbi:MAG: glutathione peroxidase [Cyclobacteriaceae bacterium]
MRLANIVSFLTGIFSSSVKREVPGSIYDFKMKNLGGKEVDFSQFKGKKILLVNTASKCGFTPQYKGLEEINKKFSERVAVLGFPANNFLHQEPGSNKEIEEFCEINYGVSFPMFEKISVRGKDKHPIYQWLEAKTGKKPDWNFAKYLVSEDGTDVTFFSAGTPPESKKIIDKLAG